MVVPNLTAFQSIMESLLESNAGISKYFSYVAVKTPICKPEYPIRALFEAVD